MEDILKTKTYGKVLLITGRGHVTDFSKRMSRYNVIFLDKKWKLRS